MPASTSVQQHAPEGCDICGADMSFDYVGHNPLDDGTQVVMEICNDCYSRHVTTTEESMDTYLSHQLISSCGEALMTEFNALGMESEALQLEAFVRKARQVLSTHTERQPSTFRELLQDGYWNLNRKEPT